MNVARTCSFFNRHQRTLTCSWTYSNSRMRDRRAHYTATKTCCYLRVRHINSCINAMNYVTYFTPARSGSNYSAYRLSATHTFRLLGMAYWNKPWVPSNLLTVVYTCPEIQLGCEGGGVIQFQANKHGRHKLNRWYIQCVCLRVRVISVCVFVYAILTSLALFFPIVTTTMSMRDPSYTLW